MKKSMKKILIASGVITGTIATAGAVSYAITKKLVGIALDLMKMKSWRLPKSILQAIQR